jgi:hypothetical protein
MRQQIEELERRGDADCMLVGSRLDPHAASDDPVERAQLAVRVSGVEQAVISAQALEVGRLGVKNV